MPRFWFLSFILLFSFVMDTSLFAQSNQPLACQDTAIGTIPRGHPKLSYQGKSVDEMIYDFMRAQRIPGLTMAIVQAPYIPRIAGYGITDLAGKGENLASTNTIYAAGQISQAYAAVAIFQLYEMKLLDIRKPLATYLEGLPTQWQKTTIYQALQHATGIPDYTQLADFDAQKNYSAEDLIQQLAPLPLAFPAGTDVQRSATNFLLLAMIVEKVSRQPYVDFITEHQIKKLHLTHTLFLSQGVERHEETLDHAKNERHSKFLQDPLFINAAEIAQGYREIKGTLTPYPFIPVKTAAFKGYADLWASAGDISIWDMGLAGGILVKEAKNRELIYKPTTLDNGKKVPAMAGWEFTHHKGFLDISGSTQGFSSYLSRFTDKTDLLCVTLMANKEGIDFTNLARKIAAAYEKSLIAENISPDLFVRESIFDAPTTVRNIKAFLASKKIPVFAVFDHEKNAKEVHLALANTCVIVFGSPAVGTKLMQANPAIAIELPLKILVWKDAKKRVWVGFKDMHRLAAHYEIPANPVLHNIQQLLENILLQSTSLMKKNLP